MYENLTIQGFEMQCKAHGVHGWRQYKMYDDSTSTAQHGNARKGWIGEASHVG
jgi:hypothetical protein